MMRSPCIQTGRAPMLEPLVRWWTASYQLLIKVPIVGSLQFDGLRDVSRPDDPYSSALTWDVVNEEAIGNHVRATIDVTLRGERVARF